MIYGHESTIHQSKKLDVEVNKEGKVVGVWFRCCALPFEQIDVDDQRAFEMIHLQKNLPLINAVDVELKN
jgi:hypothetical protein